MKPSEKLLRIPVIMYDALSLKHALDSEAQMEEQLNIALSSHAPIEFAIGYYTIKIEDVAGWSDTYTRDKTIEEVQSQGFNATEVYLVNDPPVICPLTSIEFAKLYDKLWLQLEKEEFNRQETLRQLNKKKTWFRRFIDKTL